MIGSKRSTVGVADSAFVVWIQAGDNKFFCLFVFFNFLELQEPHSSPSTGSVEAPACGYCRRGQGPQERPPLTFGRPQTETL